MKTTFHIISAVGFQWNTPLSSPFQYNCDNCYPGTCKATRFGTLVVSGCACLPPFHQTCTPPLLLLKLSHNEPMDYHIIGGAPPIWYSQTSPFWDINILLSPGIAATPPWGFTSSDYVISPRVSYPKNRLLMMTDHVVGYPPQALD